MKKRMFASITMDAVMMEHSLFTSMKRKFFVWAHMWRDLYTGMVLCSEFSSAERSRAVLKQRRTRRSELVAIIQTICLPASLVSVDFGRNMKHGGNCPASNTARCSRRPAQCQPQRGARGPARPSHALSIWVQIKAAAGS